MLRGLFSSSSPEQGALARDQAQVPRADVPDLTKQKSRFGPDPADIGGSCVPGPMGAGSELEGT